MTLKMRELKTKDLFKATKILRKLGLKNDIKKIIGEYDDKDKNRKKILGELGTDIIYTIVERMDMAENEIAEFMGDLLGIKPKDFLNLKIEDTFEAFKLFSKQEGLINFFRLALK